MDIYDIKQYLNQLYQTKIIYTDIIWADNKRDIYIIDEKMNYYGTIVEVENNIYLTNKSHQANKFMIILTITDNLIFIFRSAHHNQIYFFVGYNGVLYGCIRFFHQEIDMLINPCIRYTTYRLSSSQINERLKVTFDKLNKSKIMINDLSILINEQKFEHQLELFEMFLLMNSVDINY